MAKPIVAALVLSALAFAPGCASRYQVQASEPALAADAQVVVKKNKTGTYDVSVEMAHLPPADRLGNYASYAVWVIAKDAEPVKAGVLDYNERKRTAELEFSSPHRKFEMVITLEKDIEATKPGRVAIIEQSVKGRG
ncbi:MAG: hypothetical protein K0V04_04660 [Deltaproteobacteria bacterium]|nr:hypothetical protein [Deltaproteobacteria bacterium]